MQIKSYASMHFSLQISLMLFYLFNSNVHYLMHKSVWKLLRWEQNFQLNFNIH